VDKMGGQTDDIMPVDKPPKICEVPAKVAPVEVLPPLLAQAAPGAPPADGLPIHALSALILVAVDSLWAVFDWVPPVWVVAIPGCFAAVFVPTYLIQRHLKNDSKARALTYATILAVLAAIPTPITGTPVGLGLLAWTGLGKLFGRTPPK
jgi:integral membrane sensor domain MASE1